jgi:hypothetical protein
MFSQPQVAAGKRYRLGAKPYLIMAVSMAVNTVLNMASSDYLSLTPANQSLTPLAGTGAPPPDNSDCPRY